MSRGISCKTLYKMTPHDSHMFQSKLGEISVMSFFFTTKGVAGSQFADSDSVSYGVGCPDSENTFYMEVGVGSNSESSEFRIHY